MILLAIASCLLFFITYFTGICAVNFLKKFLAVGVAVNFPETFLFGLVACSIYFNLLSFFLPVDYRTLLPLILPCIFILFKKTARQHFSLQVRQLTAVFFSKKSLAFTLPLVALFFVYWIIPPLNRDSGEYHYIAIRWYEQFKIVPGLANVHGRLAFNPASFIISSAYSFTGLTGQSLYPLNGVLCLVFYAWLIKKILTGTLYNCVVLILAVLLFRITLINISSPSSDLLSGILLFYCGFRVYELIKEGKTALGDYFPVFVIACFSVTAKLSALPVLLIIPFIYFILVKKDKQTAFIIKSLLLAMLIIIPWLARNVVLSGYLLYPVPGTDFFHTDWTVPRDVLQMDYIFSKYGPRTITVDFFALQRMNIVQLTITWFRYISASSPSSLLISLAALFSPAAWLLFPIMKKNIPAKPFLLWCIYYCAVWIWLINSPEHRFGLPYLVVAAGLPVLELIQTVQASLKIPRVVFVVIMCLCCLHYSIDAFKKEGVYPFSIKDCWLLPLRDHRYFKENDTATFPSVPLGNGVRLYLPDENHECLNANGPCMNWRYGTIEMRGHTIEDGFRNKTDEVKKFYPFVDVK
jgi:hypothetical protein